MDKQELKQVVDEVIKVSQEATQGNWIPLGIVICCIAVLLVMFIYILNLREKENIKMHKDSARRHDKADELLNKLTESNVSISQIVAVHEAEINNLKKN